MRLDSFGAIIKSALVAGLGAGLLVAAVQFFWTEPIVDRAISVESQVHSTDSPHSAEPPAEEMPVVDRTTQKKGLFLGYTIYGLAWGLLFGASYVIAQPSLPGAGRMARSFALAGASFWAVGFLPFLKYPANPPGVGDPSTIDLRQRAYLAMLACGVASVALGAIAWRRLASRGRWAIAAGLATTAAASAVAYFALPANIDAVRMPAALVNDFRLHSLAGIALFWLAMAPTFAALLAWLTEERATLVPEWQQPSRDPKTPSI